MRDGRTLFDCFLFALMIICIIIFADTPKHLVRESLNNNLSQKVNEGESKKNNLFPPNQWYEGTIRAKGDHPFIQYLICSGRKVPGFEICCEPQMKDGTCRQDYTYVCDSRTTCVVRWTNR